MIELMLKVV